MSEAAKGAPSRKPAPPPRYFAGKDPALQRPNHKPQQHHSRQRNDDHNHPAVLERNGTHNRPAVLERNASSEATREEQQRLQESTSDDEQIDIRRQRARALATTTDNSLLVSDDVSIPQGEVSEEEAIDQRRQRLLELRRRQAQLEDALEQQTEGGESGDESSYSYSYETESEEAETGSYDTSRVLLKPYFVKDNERVTVGLKEERKREEAAATSHRETRQIERQEESRRMLAESLAGDNQATEDIDEADLPDDDDAIDEEEQFEKWWVRELRRLRREEEEVNAALRESEEMERRRTLTTEERKREDEEFARQRDDFGKEKVQWKFLQKYYHKGAFFQDEDERGNNATLGAIATRDYGAATGADAQGDRSKMPKAMQVKNFGRKGRSKWTHLTAEDTSQRIDKSESGREEWRISRNTQKRLAGYKGATDFDRPTRRVKHL